MVFIKDYLGTASSTKVEPFSAEVLLETTPDSVQKANYLNEHAVLMFYQGNMDEAETSFRASLVIRQKLLGKFTSVIGRRISNDNADGNFLKYSSSAEYVRRFSQSDHGNVLSQRGGVSQYNREAYVH